MDIQKVIYDLFFYIYEKFKARRKNIDRYGIIFIIF